MKKSYLLVCLLVNIFVGSAKTVPSISNVKFGFINEKVSRTFYNSLDTVFNPNIEKNNTNSTPPCNTASISYAGTPFCNSLTTGQAVTLTGTGTYTGGTYSAPIGLALNAATGAIIPSQSTPGNYTVSYTVSGGTGCPTVVATASIVINPKPAIPNQTVTICSGGTFTVTPINAIPTTATIVPNGTTYTWTVPIVTAGITGGSAGTSQSAIFGTLTNATNVVVQATYTVTPSVGGCVGVPFTVTVTVNPKPVIPNQTAMICSGGTFTVTPINASPTTATIVPIARP